MYKLNPDILKTPVSDNKILLLEPTKGQYFELNESSVFIFQCLNQERSDVQIIEKMVQEFNCDKSQAASDFYDLIAQFKKNHIILE